MRDRPGYWPVDRPQVVAHRGASAENAEHTLGAYRAALDEGAEALECDVRLTADGHLVCVHDRDLRRTTSNAGLVSTSDLADLDALDFARWKRPWADLDDEAAEPDPELGKVLTLRRLLETVADHPRPVELAVETKHPTRYAGLVEQRLVELLDRFGWAGEGSPVRVMSFSWLALRRMERLAPGLELVLLHNRAGDWLRRPPGPRSWTVGPGIHVVRERPDAVARLAARVPVHCWVVNEAADVDLCREVGIEAVITDQPGRTLARLEGRPSVDQG